MVNNDEWLSELKCTPPSTLRNGGGGGNETRHTACPISTGRGTRRVRSVRGEGRGVST